MRATTPAPETIRKEVRVEAPPATAYRVFTQDMSGWWPFASHSVYGSESTEAILEATPGGSNGRPTAARASGGPWSKQTRRCDS